jgi:hypothetical protein
MVKTGSILLLEKKVPFALWDFFGKKCYMEWHTKKRK